ncbi:MAG: hypothetical protein ACRCZF_21450 [Gemmataceae bacterium]
MNYKVDWLDTADEQLAGAWLASADRAAITNISRQFDRQIAHDPFAVGESRHGDLRIHFEPPLQFLYRVDVAHQRVFVISVSLIPRSC